MRTSPPRSFLLGTILLGTILLGAVPRVHELARGQSGSAAVEGDEPIVGGPCEGCEAVFQGLPAALSARTRIAPVDEPGEPLRIEGTVRDTGGEAVGGVVVYAYHTSAEGIYPRVESWEGQAAHRHGRLRAWARTDEDGSYRFDTIRPASYPGTRVPAHVHMHVIEPGRCTYYVDSIHFEDDPSLTATVREQMAEGRGGSGLVTPRRDEAGHWHVRRDIVLGRGVPGYPERASTRDRAAGGAQDR